MSKTTTVTSGSLSASTLDITSGIDSTYGDYYVILDDVACASASGLALTVYINGVEKTDANYSFESADIDSTPGNTNTTGATSIPLLFRNMHATASRLYGYIKLANPSSSTSVNFIEAELCYWDTNNNPVWTSVSGSYAGEGVLTGIKLTGANTLSGSYTLAGE